MNKGDTITICLKGYLITGEILSIQNYGTKEKPDYYIELQSKQYGYVYWKQSIDGGHIK